MGIWRPDQGAGRARRPSPRRSSLRLTPWFLLCRRPAALLSPLDRSHPLPPSGFRLPARLHSRHMMPIDEFLFSHRPGPDHYELSHRGSSLLLYVYRRPLPAPSSVRPPGPSGSQARAVGNPLDDLISPRRHRCTGAAPGTSLPSAQDDRPTLKAFQCVAGRQLHEHFLQRR